MGSLSSLSWPFGWPALNSELNSPYAFLHCNRIQPVFVPWPECFTSPEGLILNLSHFPASAPNSTVFMFYVILFLIRKLERETSTGLWVFSMNRRRYLPLGIHVYEENMWSRNSNSLYQLGQQTSLAGPCGDWLGHVISLVLSIIFWEMEVCRKMISKISLS